MMSFKRMENIMKIKYILFIIFFTFLCSFLFSNAQVKLTNYYSVMDKNIYDRTYVFDFELRKVDVNHLINPFEYELMSEVDAYSKMRNYIEALRFNQYKIFYCLSSDNMFDFFCYDTLKNELLKLTDINKKIKKELNIEEFCLHPLHSYNIYDCEDEDLKVSSVDGKFFFNNLLIVYYRIFDRAITKRLFIEVYMNTVNGLQMINEYTIANSYISDYDLNESEFILYCQESENELDWWYYAYWFAPRGRPAKWKFVKVGKPVKYIFNNNFELISIENPNK